MSTQSKTNANRRNAQRSTGPNTAAGKAASSRNAISHGLTATGITVMVGESQEDLDNLIQTLTDEHRPEGDTERFLVDQMVQARWRLARLARLETKSFDRLMEYHPDRSLDRSVVIHMEIAGNVFDKLERYRAAAERCYSKALRDLTQLRANRQKIKKQNEAKQAQDWLKSKLLDIENRPVTDMFGQPLPPGLAGQNEPAPGFEPDDTALRL